MAPLLNERTRQLTWAHTLGVTVRLIEPGKPKQDAYVESFNGRFRDECPNEHSFTSPAHAQVWRREYNEEWPKKGVSGIAPAHYANRLVAERSIVGRDRISARTPCTTSR